MSNEIEKWVVNIIHNTRCVNGHPFEHEFDSYHQAQIFMHTMFINFTSGMKQNKSFSFKLFKKDKTRNDNACRDQQDSEAYREDE